MKRMLSVFSVFTVLFGSSVAFGQIVVDTLQGNGVLSWSAPVNPSARYDIEWAYQAEGPWHKTFQNLQMIDAFNDTQFVARVPMFFRAVQVTNDYPLTMAYIEGGDTRLGQDGFADPGFTNYISSFWIDRTEVTIDLWSEVYQWAITNGYQFDNPGFGVTNRHPVIDINWYDAVKWCNARSEREGLELVYFSGLFAYKTGQLAAVTMIHSRNGYRLPTNAEWEKAARGGREGYRFPGGATTISFDQANYKGATNLFSYDHAITNDFHPAAVDGDFPYTLPVGFFPPNEFGVYDMAGNVEEWLWDPGGARITSYAINPTGNTNTAWRLYRGGSWRYEAEYLRLINNPALQTSPTNTLASAGTLGFRTVRSAW
ncbi:MAG: SUMF1/EgtB/PvdO family nonheme iron enzyme [Kiritimatiellae bacterium]|nr:SUMF1/EgtB/PvdO family nonheme iron enzyme [Kiritimatiellia bacterium]